MTTNTEATADIFRNVTNYVEPWMNAIKAWNTESQKLQQTAVDTMTKVIDDSYRLTKEGLGMMTSMANTVQQQVSAHVDRTVDMWRTFIP